MAAAPGVVGSTSKINPLSVAGLLLQFSQQKKANEAKKAKDQYEETQKVWEYNNKMGLPTTKWTDYNRTLLDQKEKNVNIIQDYLVKNPRDFNGATRLATRLADDLKVTALELDNWKSTIDKTNEKVVKGVQDGIYDRDKMPQAFLKTHLNPDGSIITEKDPVTDNWSYHRLRMGMNDIENIFNDPSNYNQTGVIKNWVTSLPEQVRTYVSELASMPGMTNDVVEQQVSSGLIYKKNPDGSLYLDDNNKPIPEINSFTLKMAKANPEAKLMIEAYGGQTEQEQIDYLQRMITPEMDKVKVQRQLIPGKNIPDEGKYTNINGINFGVGRKENLYAIERFKHIESAIKDFKPGELNQYVETDKGEQAYYLNERGTKVASVKNVDGVTMYYDEKGKRTEKPDRIVLKKLAAGASPAQVMANPNLTKTDKERAMAHQFNTVTLKIGTSQERKAAHNELNDFLDKKQGAGVFKLGDIYRTVLDHHYPNNDEKISLNASERLKNKK